MHYWTHVDGIASRKGPRAETKGHTGGIRIDVIDGAPEYAESDSDSDDQWTIIEMHDRDMAKKNPGCAHIVDVRNPKTKTIWRTIKHGVIIGEDRGVDPKADRKLDEKRSEVLHTEAPRQRVLSW